MNNNVEVFERYVRVAVSNISKDRAPTEEELRDACNIFRPIVAVTDEEMENVIKKLQTALDVSMDIGVVVEKDYEPWLTQKKDSIDFFYWNRYERYLDQETKRSPAVIASIDKVSDKVVDLAGDPTISGALHRRGLLLGDIQSGKTSNYIAIMNKAADVGYKVIILLTGTIESLRRQTQERVDEGFIGRSSKAYLQRNSQTIRKGVGSIDAQRFATGFTTESSDFKTSAVRSLNISLQNMITEPVVFVMKKNARTLKNLIGWLEDNANNQGVIDLPLLLIDDEADNASINTREDNDPTTINKYIRNLLKLFTKTSYIGVTATPFANIFILPEKNEDLDADDLFPENYIYALDSPSNYIGANEIFGDDAIFGNALIPITDADRFFPYKHKQDIKLHGLPESLYEALSYFLLANIVRDITGDPTSHRSMLVNVSRYTSVQEQVSKLILEWLYEVKRDVRLFCMKGEQEACENNNLARLRDTWNSPKYPFIKETEKHWIDIQHNYLLNAISAIEVRTINQHSASSLDYTEYAASGLRVIAVGGLALSRGLTLEGLMVSYFHRNTQMYDTLMQMGRWFGYRDGYEHLFRIWMPDDSIGWYAHITQASNELREDIARMNRIGATPKEFGLRVRAHPTSLIVTARNKMKHAERQECWITLDGEFFETPRFINNIDTIRSNRNRTDKLIAKIVERCGNPSVSGKQPLFWESAPSDLICEYVRSYKNHPLNMESNGEVLESYINKNSRFSNWNVLVVSGRENGIPIPGTEITVHPTLRPFSLKGKTLSVYGTKMRIGTMGLTKHGLTESERIKAEAEFRKSKRSRYELKYGDSAEEKLKKMSISDRAYLIENRKPIIIIHYLKAKPDSDLPKEYDQDQDLIVGYGIGFPKLSGSEPIYAVYYVNTVEQLQSFDFSDEIEEDLLNDNDD